MFTSKSPMWRRRIDADSAPQPNISRRFSLMCADCGRFRIGSSGHGIIGKAKAKALGRESTARRDRLTRVHANLGTQGEGIKIRARNRSKDHNEKTSFTVKQMPEAIFVETQHRTNLLLLDSCDRSLDSIIRAEAKFH